MFSLNTKNNNHFGNSKYQQHIVDNDIVKNDNNTFSLKLRSELWKKYYKKNTTGNCSYCDAGCKIKISNDIMKYLKIYRSVNKLSYPIVQFYSTEKLSENPNTEEIMELVKPVCYICSSNVVDNILTTSPMDLNDNTYWDTFYQNQIKADSSVTNGNIVVEYNYVS